MSGVFFPYSAFDINECYKFLTMPTTTWIVICSLYDSGKIVNAPSHPVLKMCIVAKNGKILIDNPHN